MSLSHLLPFIFLPELSRQRAGSLETDGKTTHTFPRSRQGGWL